MVWSGTELRRTSRRTARDGSAGTGRLDDESGMRRLNNDVGVARLDAGGSKTGHDSGAGKKEACETAEGISMGAQRQPYNLLSYNVLHVPLLHQCILKINFRPNVHVKTIVKECFRLHVGYL